MNAKNEVNNYSLRRFMSTKRRYTSLITILNCKWNFIKAPKSHSINGRKMANWTGQENAKQTQYFHTAMWSGESSYPGRNRENERNHSIALQISIFAFFSVYVRCLCECISFDGGFCIRNDGIPKMSSSFKHFSSRLKMCVCVWQKELVLNCCWRNATQANADADGHGFPQWLFRSRHNGS